MRDVFVRKRFSRFFSQLSGWLVFGLIIGIYITPILLVISNISPDSFIELLKTRSFLNALSFSLIEATTSAIFSLIIGLPGAWLLARYNYRHKGIIRNALWIPFMMPPSVVSAGILFLLGESGIFSSMGLTLSGFWLVIYSHVFFNAPLVTIVVSNEWEQLDPRLEESAEVLGASPTRKMFRVVLPALMPAILYSFALVFIYSFMAFTTVLILGGVSYRTIEVEIYSLYAILLRDDMAASATIIQFLVLSFLLVSVLRRPVPGMTTTPFHKRKEPVKIFTVLYGIFFSLIILSPLIAIIIKGLIKPIEGTLTLDGYIHVFSMRYDVLLGTSPFRVLLNTIFFGTVTMIVTVSLSLCIATIKKRNTASTILTIPSAISTMMLTIGLFMLWRIIDPMRAHGWLMVCMAHTLMAFPFVQKGVISALEAVPPELKETAMILGETPWRTFKKVELPLVSSRIIAMGLLAFTYSIGEMGATMILGGREWMTLSVMIKVYLGRRAFLFAAAASGFLLMISTALVVLMGIILNRGLKILTGGGRKWEK